MIIFQLFINDSYLSLYLISMNSSQEEVDLYEDNMYVVEKILRRQYRRREGRREPHYLIRWQGFPKQQDFTWEPLSNLTSVNFMVEEFQARLIEKKKRESLMQAEQKNVNDDKKEIKMSLQKNNTKSIDFQHQEEDKIKKKIKSDQSQKQKMKIHDSKPLQPPKMDTLKDPIILKFPQIDKKAEVLRKEQKDQKQSKQSKMLKQQKIQKQQKVLNQMDQKVIYGRVVNHMYQNGRMIYEVERLNNEKKVFKIVSISSDKAQTLCLKAVVEYLQSFLIDLQSLNKSQ